LDLGFSERDPIGRRSAGSPQRQSPARKHARGQAGLQKMTSGAVRHLSPSNSPILSRTDPALCGDFLLASKCTVGHNTGVIPFRVTFKPGASLYEQVVYAAKKALVSGQLRPGDPFPSVRTLSAELKINPNTAHKVVTQLLNEGLLEVHAGAGTAVAAPPVSTAAQCARLLDNEVEQLAVEAKRLGM